MPFSLLIELVEIPLDLRVNKMTILNKELLEELLQYVVFHVKMTCSICRMYAISKWWRKHDFEIMCPTIDEYGILDRKYGQNIVIYAGLNGQNFSSDHPSYTWIIILMWTGFWPWRSIRRSDRRRLWTDGRMDHKYIQMWTEVNLIDWTK